MSCNIGDSLFEELKKLESILNDVKREAINHKSIQIVDDVDVETWFIDMYNLLEKKRNLEELIEEIKELIE